MDGYRRVAALKIQAAQDRTHAVIEEVARVENKVYVSPGSQNILCFVRDAAARIEVLLEDQKPIASSSPLTEADLEIRLDRTTKLLPFLYELVGFVEGSDVHHSPGQLIPALRRYSQLILPTSEIVVSSKAELNYSIQEIAGPLKKLFGAMSVKKSCDLLPELLFVVNIPAVESEQILIHAVLAHELGHALYDRREVAKGLLPKIKLNEDLVKNLAKTIYEGQLKHGSPTPELRLRERVTEEITIRVNGWVKELCSDAIGVRLFGPALFLAAAHLFTSFIHIDKCSATHPPPRLRIRLMIRMLKQLYPVDKWRGELQSFTRDWDEVSAGQISGGSRYDQVAQETINEAALDLIADASAVATSTAKCYTPQKFDHDMAKLAPFFLNHIPPGEMGPYGRGTPVELASIINAGWHVYLCDFEKFRRSLHPQDSGTRFTAATKLHELVLKALEISEMKTAWEEARRDPKRGKN